MALFRASRTFFGIIAFEGPYRASTCVKTAYQRILIKWMLLGSKICFYIFILLGKKEKKISKVGTIFVEIFS